MTRSTRSLLVLLAVWVAVAGCTAPPQDAVSVQPGSNTTQAWAVNPWQSSDLTAAIDAPIGNQGSLTGYAFEAGDTQHLFFTAGPDNHVHEMWWDLQGWHVTDLTAVAGGAEPDPASLAAYVAEAESSQHVVYAATADRHVYQLSWTAEGGWRTDDLSAISGAPPATATVTGYSVASQLGKHVLYLRKPDRHVQEIWWDGLTWHTQDLSAATGAPAALEGALVGYVDEAQAIQHVIYAGINSHIYELWCDAAGWHMTDLTAVTGAPGPVAGTVAGYMFDAQGTQHVFYVGVDAKIYELWTDSTGWHSSDLTTMTGAPAPSRNALAAYAFESQGTQHVIYTGVDGLLYELWWESGRWQVGSLSAGVRSPKPAKAKPVAYAFERQATQHVLYQTASDLHLYELWSGNPKG